MTSSNGGIEASTKPLRDLSTRSTLQDVGIASIHPFFDPVSSSLAVTPTLLGIIPDSLHRRIARQTSILTAQFWQLSALTLSAPIIRKNGTGVTPSRVSDLLECSWLVRAKSASARSHHLYRARRCVCRVVQAFQLAKG